MHSMFFIIIIIHWRTLVFFLAASLRERDERAARKAAKKQQKTRQVEAANAQHVEAAAVQSQVAIANGVLQTRNSQFYSQMPQSASAQPTLFPSADFTNTGQSTPVTPIFQGTNLTLPPRSHGGWNPNQYINSESSPASNELEPWNQHHDGNQTFTGTGNFY